MPRPAFIPRAGAEVSKGSHLETPNVLLRVIAEELHLPDVAFMKWNAHTATIVVVKVRAGMHSDFLAVRRILAAAATSIAPVEHVHEFFLHLWGACGFKIFPMNALARYAKISPLWLVIA